MRRFSRTGIVDDLSRELMEFARPQFEGLARSGLAGTDELDVDVFDPQRRERGRAEPHSPEGERPAPVRSRLMILDQLRI